MPQFRYVARSADGKLVDGVVTSNDRSAAIRQVEQQRFVPIKIEPIASAGDAPAAPRKAAPSKSPSTASREPSTSPVANATPAEAAAETMTHSQTHLFTEQLANLLGAGMTLDESLSVPRSADETPAVCTASRAGCNRALVDGRSLSQALRDYPRIFSPLYVNMVAAGEASGALADILRRLVAHLADVKGLRDRVAQALLYPAMLVVAGVVLIVIFVTVMVPQLTGFFAEAGGTLPASTQLLLQANAFLTHWWWAVLGAMAGLFFGWKAFVSAPSGRLAWDTFTWRIPVYGLVLRYRFYAQFARTLATLVENGVTLLRALELLEEISGNEFARLKLADVRRAVVDGATLSAAVSEQQLFPELFVDMMSVGEQTGRFGQTMNNIAEVYERELGRQVGVISTLIPPLIMLAVAGVVGFVVFGILSAVFSMTSGLRAGGH